MNRGVDIFEDQLPENDEAGVGIMPLIDVVFQLLVFFMLTSTFVSPALDLTLPQLADDVVPRDEFTLDVSVGPSGEVWIDGEAVGDDLASFLNTRLGALAEMPVAALRADRETAYDQLMRILRELGSAGVQQIHFVYEVGD
ncbi:MAG: biopolymer transporter ExbD [Opitutales bacterium]|nr:biopolymer transporter ExbD [Opitutales bacterium]